MAPTSLRAKPLPSASRGRSVPSRSRSTQRVVRLTDYSQSVRVRVPASNDQYDEAMRWVLPILDLQSEAWLVLRISPALDQLRLRPDYRQALESRGLPVYSLEPSAG